MMELINELKAEHSALLSTLTKIKEIGILNDDSIKLLFLAKDLLIKHLEHEDKKLYPKLKLIYADDMDSLKKTQEFIDEMEEASVVILSFFEKYETISNADTFRMEYLELLAVLLNRIKREEGILFPIYLNKSGT